MPVQSVTMDTVNTEVLSALKQGEISQARKENISTLISRAHTSVVSATVDADNFLVLNYGEEDEYKLMIQMYPCLESTSSEETAPRPSWQGSSGLTHFEVRRDKECGTEGGQKKVEKRKLKRRRYRIVTEARKSWDTGRTVWQSTRMGREKKSKRRHPTK